MLPSVIHLEFTDNFFGHFSIMGLRGVMGMTVLVRYTQYWLHYKNTLVEYAPCQVNLLARYSCAVIVPPPEIPHSHQLFPRDIFFIILPEVH